MRLPWVMSVLGATVMAAVSCTAPPTPPAVVASTPAPPPSPSPRRQAEPRVREKVTDVYAHDRPGMLSPKVRDLTPRVYVPNSESNTVDVIDPRTYRVVHRYRVGMLPQHVVPSWDLKTLWVNENKGNRLTPIDPVTGRPGKPVPVDDPYNLYFTPDGSYAVVMAERNNRLDFRDPDTMRLIRSLELPCRGVNHGDFTADGSVFLASCEFSGQLVVIDWKRPRVLKVIGVGSANMPQDVKLSPDGRLFYVADMMAGGVWIIDAATLRRVGFLRTGRGAHGLYVSRDSQLLYVSNRGEGSVSVVSFADRKVVDRWQIPGGGSPDMGGVSADGKQLWLSGRYHGVVYVFSTVTGELLHKIKVGRGPHGLCVYPQPGRYSLGHTGIFR
ncbi:YncE family protein [Nonomuraea sp. NPDC005983]|uniref:YncE family protein n=1 Tax=Nonomuraea sp. NPDC005983 TaxID=3155595 RepID=UPI0033ADB365